MRRRDNARDHTYGMGKISRARREEEAWRKAPFPPLHPSLSSSVSSRFTQLRKRRAQRTCHIPKHRLTLTAAKDYVNNVGRGYELIREEDHFSLQESFKLLT
jgi:hypothetical protein